MFAFNAAESGSAAFISTQRVGISESLFIKVILPRPHPPPTLYSRVPLPNITSRKPGAERQRTAPNAKGVERDGSDSVG